MLLLTAPPVWVIAVAIFLLRVVDVSIGTIRTIAMIQGRTRYAVLLGFLEVMVWVIAVAQVVTRLGSDPWLAPFYAGGHATGVGVGMFIERRLSLGRYLVRIITHSKTAEISAAVGRRGKLLATFPGHTPAGPMNLIFVSAMGKRVPSIIEDAQAVDPDLFYTVESATSWSANVHPLKPPSSGWRGGWRARFLRR